MYKNISETSGIHCDIQFVIKKVHLFMFLFNPAIKKCLLVLNVLAQYEVKANNSMYVLRLVQVVSFYTSKTASSFLQFTSKNFRHCPVNFVSLQLRIKKTDSARNSAPG